MPRMPKDVKFIHELPDGSYRESTAKEIKDALVQTTRLDALLGKKIEIEKEIREITNDCQHLVCWDEFGHVYSTRHCVLCGYFSHL